MSGLRLLSLQLALAAPALAVKGDGGPPGTEDYFWPKRGGTYIGHGAVPYKLVDFTKKPAWTWENHDDELFRHGPVIDHKKNVYAVTSCGWIRKFSPDGNILWSHRFSPEEGKTVTSPFLYKGQLFLSSMGPYSAGYNSLVHCFDMETGNREWVKPAPVEGHVNHDSSTMHVAEGVMLGAMISIAKPAGHEGNNLIYAMNATDGRNLWQFTMDDASVVWNFMPSTPGDGTFFFSNSCGVARRHKLIDGSLIWKSKLRTPQNGCSTGGGTLGANGVFYAEANHFFSSFQDGIGAAPLPGLETCDPTGCAQGAGILVAHRAEDGEVLWSRRLGRMLGEDPLAWSGMQYPAVAKVDGRFIIAASIGQNPNLPTHVMGDKWLPESFQMILALAQFKYAWLRKLMGFPAKRNGVITIDAETGKELWRFEEEPFTFFSCKGDEPLIYRIPRTAQDPRMEAVCGPDNFGIPAIAADGTVLIGSGSWGRLYAIRDANGDGAIQDSEVSMFDYEQAFLNGPALAPGMMAVAPCWGKMYVYKGDV